VDAPGLLVDAEWLSRHLDQPGVRVLDVRWSAAGGADETRRAFEEAHIPGAALVDMDRDLSAAPFIGGPGRHPLPPAGRFAALMGSLGVGDGTLVIAYDDAGGSLAARLWWMLEATGRSVALLDGGLESWRGRGGAVEAGPPASRDPAAFAPVSWPGGRIVDAAGVGASIRSGTAVVLDARAGERYRGEQEPIDPVAGHIPGARSAPWTGNLDEGGRFLPPGVLRARYQALGAGGGAAVAYCGSGVTACHDLFAMRLAGFDDLRLYVGSWSDWVHDRSRPVAR
jgi:thiosulfate/3-mercaptopyruvate sulfurtransferase